MSMKIIKEVKGLVVETDKKGNVTGIALTGHDFGAGHIFRYGTEVKISENILKKIFGDDRLKDEKGKVVKMIMPHSGGHTSDIIFIQLDNASFPMKPNELIILK